MGKYSFRFNKKTEQNIQNYQRSIAFNKELQNRFKNIISIFDRNNDQKLNSSEIKQIWAFVLKNSKANSSTEEKVLSLDNLKSIPEESKGTIISFLNIIANTINKSPQTKKLRSSIQPGNGIPPQKKYTMENIKRNYPKDYHIEKFNIGNGINVYDNEYQIVAQYEYVLKNYEIINYDQNANITSRILENDQGQIEEIEKDGNISYPLQEKEIQENKQIVQNLVSDIYAKNKLGLPTTGENIEKHVLQITDNNVHKILEMYKKLNKDKETLYDAIDNEIGLSSYKKNKLKLHIAQQENNYSEIIDSAIEIKDTKPIQKIILNTTKTYDKFILYFFFSNVNIVHKISNSNLSKEDKNLLMNSIESFLGNNQTEKLLVTTEIEKDITAKNKLGFPTTGKDLEKHIKYINPGNVLSIFNQYLKISDGENLIEAIEDEWGLDKDTKDRIIKHLNKCVMQTGAYKPNCKIDQHFQQGETGDCWFLSSIAAITRSPNALKILNNTITDNRDGTYTVKFKGADKAYTVNIAEIAASKKLSSGEIDVRILEIAAKKHFYIQGINGGNPAIALDLLLGTNDKWLNVGRLYRSKPNPKKIKELLKNPNIVMTAGINPFSKLYGIIFNSIDDKEKYKDDITTVHTYAVMNIDDKYIYLQDPWQTDKTIAIPLDVFDDYWANVQYTKVK